MARYNVCTELRNTVVSELMHAWNGIRETRLTPGFILAIICVVLVIVGNVILLIAINFWIVAFPTVNLEHNSSQIAIQVVATMFLVLFFMVITAVFTAYYGVRPLWRVLTDTNRVHGPLYRLFLLFLDGASNGICSLLGVYSMTYTPEFVQAVLLCAIPFSAQAWTVLLIPEERKRNYLSIFFIASVVFFVAGVLLSSLSAFIHKDENGNKAPWSWALIYLASSILFGLWCVVQRLYLDAMIVVEEDGAEEDADVYADKRGIEIGSKRSKESTKQCEAAGVPATRAPREVNEQEALINNEPIESSQQPTEVELKQQSEDEEDETAIMTEKRQWGKQSVDDNSAKLVLLVGGLLFQLLVSFVCFPIDAIPWFGTSSTALEAWVGFRNSVNFIFASWHNVRFGLLYSLGYAMSFIGCTYLNEHSPTLASVVLQLAGPITSLVIIIIPQWDVYGARGNVGQKVGGVILLLVAAVLYHLWEQRSLREMLEKAHEEEEEPLHAEEFEPHNASASVSEAAARPPNKEDDLP